MPNTERKRTLLEIHEEVARIDLVIGIQQAIVAGRGRTIIKEFLPLEDTPPEEIIDNIYFVGQRRNRLIERVNLNSLPYLQEKRAGEKQKEAAAVSQARDAYEGIQALINLGVYSPEEQTLLEKGISRLPEDLAKQIRPLPVKTDRLKIKREEPGQESEPGFFKRLFRKRKKLTDSDSPIIDSVPSLRSNVLPIATATKERIISSETAEPTDKTPVTGRDPIEPFQGEIPDVEKIVGKKAILQQYILTAIFEATLANENLTKTDYAKRLFQKELEDGSVTEEKAVKMFVDSLQWIKKKARIHGYEIYSSGKYSNVCYKVGVINASEHIKGLQRDELHDVSTPPSLLAEAPKEAAEAEIQFPNGEFLGNENSIHRRIYEAIIEFSSQGMLPTSEDLENMILGEQIKSGEITQALAHIKIRDGLTKLRSKLNDTEIGLVNKGTTRFPFYKLEIGGQISKTVFRPTPIINTTEVRESRIINDIITVITTDSEFISFPPPEVIGKEKTLTRRYYEFLLARHTDGVTTTIEEEADYLYQGHSRAEMTRIYAMRQLLNRLLEPYGIRIGTEKRNVKADEKTSILQTAETGILTPPAAPISKDGSVLDQAGEGLRQNKEPEKPGGEANKITLRAGERKTLLILAQTSAENSMTDQQIAEGLSPGKKIRKDDINTIRIFIAGLKAISLPGTGIEILHPLTKDGNPVLDRHYLKLPEGKRLADLVDLESGVPLLRQADMAERIAVPVASVDLQEGTAAEIPSPTTPERQEASLPHFVLHEAGMEAEFSGKRSRFRFADQWEVFTRIAQRPNEELTLSELAGLDSETRDTKALERAENHFRNLMTRFEEDPYRPKIFIITGGNRYPRFTFRATAKLVSDPNRYSNVRPS